MTSLAPAAAFLLLILAAACRLAHASAFLGQEAPPPVSCSVIPGEVCENYEGSKSMSVSSHEQCQQACAEDPSCTEGYGTTEGEGQVECFLFGVEGSSADHCESPWEAGDYATRFACRMEEHSVEGSMTMEVEDPEAACADDALLLAFKKTTAGLAGGKAEDVETTCSVVSRRLSSNSRRLVGSIEYSYTMPMVSKEAANTVVSAIAATPAATFTNLINVNLPANYVYSITVTKVAPPTTMSKLAPVPTTEDSDEHHSCTVVLYEGCFEGKEVTFHEGDWVLNDEDIGDKASSMRVMGIGCKVQLNPDSEDDGSPWQFGEGEYNCTKFSKVADDDSASWMRVWYTPPKCRLIPKDVQERLKAIPCPDGVKIEASPQ